MSLSSCSTTPGTAEADACLLPDPRAVQPEVSILLAAHAILRLSIKKEESGLRDFFVEWGTTPLLPDCGSSSAKFPRIDRPTSQLVSALGSFSEVGAPYSNLRIIPGERTFSGRPGMSVWCQEPTLEAVDA
jgi:hypothetical protein